MRGTGNFDLQQHQAKSILFCLVNWHRHSRWFTFVVKLRLDIFPFVVSFGCLLLGRDGTVMNFMMKTDRKLAHLIEVIIGPFDLRSCVWVCLCVFTATYTRKQQSIHESDQRLDLVSERMVTRSSEDPQKRSVRSRVKSLPKKLRKRIHASGRKGRS